MALKSWEFCDGKSKLLLQTPIFCGMFVKDSLQLLYEIITRMTSMTIQNSTNQRVFPSSHTDLAWALGQGHSPSVA